MKREIHCFRWIQLPINEVEELAEKDENFKKEYGYEYVDEATNRILVEFHVDDHPSFMEKVKHLPFGGNLSVRKRKDEKPLIQFGQDEAIYRQFLLTLKQWYMPDGTTTTNPK